MNKAYEFFLHNNLLSFVKKVVLFCVFVLLVFIILHFVGKHFTQNSTNMEKGRKVLQMTTSRNASVNANRQPILNAFNGLSNIKKENKLFGRQYIIEHITNVAKEADIFNFVIETITQKENAIKVFYPDFEDTQGITMYELEITFHSVLFKQRQKFIDSLLNDINGTIVIFETSTKRMIKDINHQLLQEINNGGNVSMLTHRLVLHWFFIK